jgi:hypothetical protein
MQVRKWDNLYGALIRSEVVKWKKVVKEAGIEAQ